MIQRSDSDGSLLCLYLGVVVYFIDRVAESVSVPATDKLKQGGYLFRFDPGSGVSIGHALPVDGCIDSGGSDNGGHHILPFGCGIEQLGQMEEQAFAEGVT